MFYLPICRQSYLLYSFNPADNRNKTKHSKGRHKNNLRYVYLSIARIEYSIVNVA